MTYEVKFLTTRLVWSYANMLQKQTLKAQKAAKVAQLNKSHDPAKIRKHEKICPE